tara:strand:+ start:50 stop:448 length:399 start_codon:yes stop_codon:yes gene_type:complete
MKIPTPPKTITAAEADRSLYGYAATVDAAYDADTLTVTIDLGLKVFVREKVRLARIDAPEVRGIERPEGLIARDWVREHIVGQKVYLRTIRDKKGKYGRYLAEVYYWQPPWMDLSNLSDRLVRLGLAHYQEY